MRPEGEILSKKRYVSVPLCEIKGYLFLGTTMSISYEISIEIEKRLRNVPVLWDGKEAVLEMKENGDKGCEQQDTRERP